MKGWKKIFQADRDQKKAEVAILISDKIDFTTKAILSDMSIAPPAFFWSLFAMKIFFQPFIFSLYVSPVLRWVSCRQHM